MSPMTARRPPLAALAAVFLLAGTAWPGLGPAAVGAQEARVAEPAGREAPRDHDGRVRAGDRAAEPGRERPAEPGRDRPAADANARRLPPDSTTEHTVEAGGRTLRFKATAGSIPLFDGEGGALRAEVAYVAFTLMPGPPSAGGPPPAGGSPPAGGAPPASGSAPAGGAPATPATPATGTAGALDPATRPVTVLFNGGPGAASAYLNIGAIGPWRLPLDGASVSSPPVPVANAETWLPFTDLVFVDPPGTGYSRVVGGGDARRQFWSVDGDAEGLAVFVRKWIEQNARQRSPKVLVGESYGGFRAPKLARALATREGVGVRGLVLVSPVLDFAALGQRRHDPQSWVRHLPSMAATVLEQRGAGTPEALAAAEEWAATDYLAALMRGERDAAAIARIVPRLAELTGLDPALVRQLAGRIDTATFQRELYRARGLVGSAYDATVTAFDPSPAAARSHFPDPVLDATKAPLTAAMTELYRGRLGWSHDQPYRLLNDEVNSNWNWGRGRSAPQVVDELRTFLSGDRAARLLVVHGASDLVTPYFATKLILDQLPVYGAPERSALAVYRGGHMFYSQDDSRKAMRRDAEAFFRAVLKGASGE